MIQIINYSGKMDKIPENVTVSKIENPQSLDSYEIVFVDYRDTQIWHNHSSRSDSVDMRKDIVNLNKMIFRSKTAKIIIILPQNTDYNYHYGIDYESGYEHFLDRESLKNMTNTIIKILFEMESVYPFKLIFENTNTLIGETEVGASFYFEQISNDRVLTRSEKSNKITAITYQNMIITSLNLSSLELMMKFYSFLVQKGNKKEEVPEWMESLRMFDDESQYEIIRINEESIKESNSKIAQAKATIQKNNEFKSVLYTNGDELVEVVFEILQEITGCNLDLFIDKKKEDFLFQLEDHVYIGEIKGVSHNVKNENISQLDVHYQSYLDEHPEIEEDKVSAILIINYQKNKPLEQREDVHENQIKLAQRNGSLIISTYILLKMFEGYRKNVYTREQCLGYLREKGMLEL